MECMNNSNNLESKLWRLLEKEGLGDLAQFHQPRSFDEVPLYSRESDVAFLPRASASEVLLRFALKYLRAVISYEHHRTPYFAAITIWGFSQDDPIVPSLFIWSGPLKKLKDRLTLSVVTTSFGMRVNRMVSRSGLQTGFELAEDTSTLPDATRVFIAPAEPPYPSFAPLETFLELASQTGSS
jgi:hypothetical protein